MLKIYDRATAGVFSCRAIATQFILTFCTILNNIAEGRRKKEEGRRKKKEERRKKEEGRRKK
ncbi:hypothetical protein K4039_01700 [Lyngbya sp. CCAP 1446/10]|uniref:hypothetical protein n=1 Tax=Microcoleaceae TaxID=1892252 RepID=UPI0022389A5D|nr:hypothetical protein [Lyngbya sp. CCAP 1446/10]MCW6048824.1 hypothetical protein [Lyngbya sp. CCAP 1446/10]